MLCGIHEKYFKNLINVDDGREAQLNNVQLNGMNRNLRMAMELTENDVRKSVNKLKEVKSPGMGITSEMLKYAGESVYEWHTMVYIVCLRSGEMPVDWKGLMIVPFY